jgi:hypothetical protein
MASSIHPTFAAASERHWSLVIERYHGSEVCDGFEEPVGGINFVAAILFPESTCLSA